MGLFMKILLAVYEILFYNAHCYDPIGNELQECFIYKVVYLLCFIPWKKNKFICRHHDVMHGVGLLPYELMYTCTETGYFSAFFLLYSQPLHCNILVNFYPKDTNIYLFILC